MAASFIGVEPHIQQYIRYNITWWPVLLVLNTTLNNMSGITYNMVASFIGVENHFQQCVSYSVWWSVLLVLNALLNNM
jgi:hypothetical protein